MTRNRPILIDAQQLKPGDAVWHVDAFDAFEQLTTFHRRVKPPVHLGDPEVIERIEERWNRGSARFFYVGSDVPEEMLLTSVWRRPSLAKRFLRRLGFSTKIRWEDELWVAPVWASIRS